jgi:hypothetical protein
MKNVRNGLLLVVFLAACATIAPAQTCDSLDAVYWLLGDWQASIGEDMTVESWRAGGPGTFEGFAETRSRASNELINSESLRLVEMSGEVFYIAKVRHNDLPVAFKMTTCSNNIAVFENPNHDFPRRLEYRFAGEGRITVNVSDGVDEGFTVNFETKVETTETDTPFCDEITAAVEACGMEPEVTDTGDTCRVHAGAPTATVAEGPSPSMVIRSYLEDSGWSEDLQYAADGPGTSGFTFRKGEILCRFSVGAPAYLEGGRIISAEMYEIDADCPPEAPEEETPPEEPQ